MKFQAATIATFLASTAVAAPVGATDELELANKIAAIMPESVSCEGRGEECRTNVEIAPHLKAAFEKHGMTSCGEQAGVLALLALESVSFQYKYNQNPDHHGQGTSNQMQFQYTLPYALSYPELVPQVAQIHQNGSIAHVAGYNPAQMKAVLDLVIPDEYNFGSGPWFLATQCSHDTRVALQKGDLNGWLAYNECIGVDGNHEERLPWFTKAQAAFSLSG